MSGKRKLSLVNAIYRYIKYSCLLPAGSEERGVLGAGSIPVAILHLVKRQLLH